LGPELVEQVLLPPRLLSLEDLGPAFNQQLHRADPHVGLQETGTGRLELFSIEVIHPMSQAIVLNLEASCRRIGDHSGHDIPCPTVLLQGAEATVDFVELPLQLGPALVGASKLLRLSGAVQLQRADDSLEVLHADPAPAF
jgi:hypothetical protein